MKSLHWKIIVVCLIVVSVPLLLLNQYVVDFFDTFTRRGLEEHMIDSAVMVGELYKNALDENGEMDAESRRVLEHALQVYGPEVQARIHVLDPQGRIVLDSTTNHIARLDISDRPEVAGAIRTLKYKARPSLTADGSRMYYYCALPLIKDEELVGIAYIYRHTGQIINAIQSLIQYQGRATLLGFGAATGLAILLGLTITRRLRRLTRRTGEYASGRGTPKLEMRGHDEIAELGAAIQKMATEIDRRHRYNHEFISTVMHELKMPLTSIKGAAELLSEGAADKPEARDKFIRNIRYGTDRMIRMVGELGELTKLDHEAFGGQKEDLPYDAFIRDVVGRLLPTFDGAHAELILDLQAGDTKLSIMPGRIEQVLANLLENAFRYTPGDGSVALRTYPEEEWIVTEVSDTGPGVASTNVDKVFDRFFTTESKGISRDYGSGLGLAIAESIVRNHGGRIWCEPSERGAVFRFRLPVVD